MMTRLSVSSAALLFVMAGCTASHLPGEEVPDIEGDAGVCAPAFDPCERDEDCCGASYCSGPYGPTVCTPTSDDGVFCVDARECTSGTCVENVCGGVLPTCVAAGDACGADVACCSGTTCRADASGGARCLPPSPDGEPCADASECASGLCSSGRCGPPPPPTGCLTRGDGDCRADGATCCEGHYCEADGYLEGYCLPYLADGEHCFEGFGAPRCASGVCADGMCRAAACTATGAECVTGTHAECCTGFCDFGFSYGPGVCRDRLPAGDSCYDHAWCASGLCNDDHTCG